MLFCQLSSVPWNIIPLNRGLTGGVVISEHKVLLLDRRLGIAGKSQAKVSAVQIYFPSIFRGIVCPSQARVQTTQEGASIQLGRNEVQEEISGVEE